MPPQDAPGQPDPRPGGPASSRRDPATHSRGHREPQPQPEWRPPGERTPCCKRRPQVGLLATLAQRTPGDSLVLHPALYLARGGGGQSSPVAAVPDRGPASTGHRDWAILVGQLLRRLFILADVTTTNVLGLDAIPGPGSACCATCRLRRILLLKNLTLLTIVGLPTLLATAIVAVTAADSPRPSPPGVACPMLTSGGVGNIVTSPAGGRDSLSDNAGASDARSGGPLDGSSASLCPTPCGTR